MSSQRRRLAKLEKIAGPVTAYPSLSEISWSDVVVRLPLHLMYPGNPEIWRRHGQPAPTN